MTDVDEAAEAIRQVARDPERHSRAARRIAERYFDTRVVLGRLLEELDVPTPQPLAHR